MIVDIQGIVAADRSFLVKELTVIAIDCTSFAHWMFKHPKSIEGDAKTNFWLKKYLHGMDTRCGDVEYNELPRIMKLLRCETIYVKGAVKKRVVEKHMSKIIAITSNPLQMDKSSSVDITSINQKVSTVFCKICHSGGSYEQLMQPCFCKGSVGHVHLTCLEKWLNECGDDKCELCLFRFQAERQRRYSALRSLVIWVRHPPHRHILYSDLSVMIILTTVVIFLITCLTIAMRQFKTLDPRYPEIWGRAVVALFIIITLLGYGMSMYMIIRDNLRPWYRWWRSCNVIRLNRNQLIQQNNSDNKRNDEIEALSLHNVIININSVRDTTIQL
ncbi:E3 ubiquitin-protein ligase MARCHF2-like [Daktulosphaira vitifoliae]|uniref:E3 ubiquitin-protein ligase MARCHF2-like n=1 Tax=Daktulosphaira vitifoliae TaxID=58002 RepID=UPI0021AAD0D5|nr:E3 ubiquitin-protein ligase MARCHF2-like [Daktulosphaira vitifoliae]